MGNTKKLVKVGVVAATALALLVTAACSSTSGAVPNSPAGRIRPVLVTASVAPGNALSLPLAMIQSNWNSRFAVATPNGQEIFMAYFYKGQTYIRASVCPPCQSQSFSLVGDTLVCDACGTVFYAQSGAGKVGPCVRYPKQAVATQLVDGNIIMKNADLLAAYQKTLNP